MLRGRVTYVQKFCRERSPADTCCVCFDDANHLLNLFGRYSQTSADPTDGCRRRCHEWVCAEIDIKHKCISSFNQDSLLRCRTQGIIHVDHGIGDVWFQSFCECLCNHSISSSDSLRLPRPVHLVSEDLCLRVIFEMTVAFESILDNLPKFLREYLVVEKMVHSKTGS
jgi:hypothetical protein